MAKAKGKIFPPHTARVTQTENHTQFFLWGNNWQKFSENFAAGGSLPYLFV